MEDYNPINEDLGLSDNNTFLKKEDFSEANISFLQRFYMQFGIY